MKLCAWRVFFGVVPKMCMPKMCINVNTISKTYLIKRDRIFGQATCIGPILSVFTFVLSIYFESPRIHTMQVYYAGVLFD